LRGLKAIFKKQIKDIMKNMSVLIQFIIFPVVAFAMTELVVDDNFNMPRTIFVTMMASVFVGMALITVSAGIIAEDREKKSLRFLIMAGVKPSAYLLGIGGVILLVSLLPTLAFGLIGRFSREEFVLFVAVMVSTIGASILLGLTVGIFANNQQAAMGLAMPIAVVLGFGPMISSFNGQVAQIFSPFYTQQLNVVVDNFYSVNGSHTGTSLWQPFTIIWANIAVLIALFTFAFMKKSLN